MYRLSSSCFFSALCCLSTLTATVAKAADSLDEIRAVQQRLRNLPLADLMNLTVTSVSKQAQSLAESAAAVFVITQDDIQRSGATSVPEALRMVPGLQVARIDASQWSVSARGFAGRYANKLLVLVDGRSIYTPIFGGVDWDEQDLLLEDIERIEVIRGSGASLWGANAVNGVINILTQATADTQGGQLIAGVGSEMRAFGAARFGGTLGDHAHYRAYIKATEQDNSRSVSEIKVNDNWQMASGGFKLDWQVTDSDLWTVDGRAYQGDIGQTLVTFELEPFSQQPLSQSYTIDGGHLLSRWQRRWSPSSEHQLQLYYNRSRRADPVIWNQVNTLDIDFQHYFMPAESQTITWGLGYRRIDSKTIAGLRAFTNPTRRKQNLFNSFLQSEWQLLDEQLTLTLGAKLEHTFFTGWEFQPSVKLLWRINPQQIIWGSVSRAIRTPSIIERDGHAIASVILDSERPVLLSITGIANDQFDSERLLSYELGYRFLPDPAFSLDIAAYYTVSHNLRSFSRGTLILRSTPVVHLESQHQFINENKGASYGIELSSHWTPHPQLRFQLAYSWTRLDLRTADITDERLLAANLIDEQQTPQQQVSLRASFDLPQRTDLDLWLRYTDRIKQDSNNIRLDDYFSLDMRLAWQVVDTLELSLVGKNLLDRSRQEFPLEVSTGYPSELERSVYFKIDWRF